MNGNIDDSAIATGPSKTAEPALPPWRRLVFCAVVPNLVFYLLLDWFSVPMSLNALVATLDTGSGVFDVLLSMFLIAAAVVLFVLPITAYTIRMAFRPWKRWYTAMLGGFLGVAVGMAIGGAALIGIHLLTR